jgi:hypothetical protein
MGSRIDATAASLGGLQLAQARLAGDAQRIARDPGDIDALVDLSVQRAATGANVAALRATSATEGALVDLLA